MAPHKQLNKLLLSAALAATILACSRETPAPELPPPGVATAELIFSGGDIVTMNDQQPGAQALAVRDGKILAVGSGAEVELTAGPDTRRIDLAGKTLVPGFIDGHSHFSMAISAATWANLSGAPVGKIQTIADAVAELRAQAQRNSTRPGEWLVGYGYDADTLADGRQMTRDDLDGAFPDIPVVAIHVSYHGAVLNSKAFEAIGYDEHTPTPAGGIIVRREDSDEPLGLVMETAWFPAAQAMPRPEGEARFDNLRRAQEMYAAHGYTTVQDGAADHEGFSLYKQAAERGELFLDLFALGSFMEQREFIAEHDRYANYRGRLKLGGIKIVGDGSPQGKTAFFTSPYLSGGPAGEENWRGEPIVEQAALDQLIETTYKAGMRAFVHANGDAAVDMLLKAHEKHQGLAGEDSRTVIIHSQFIRPEQLQKYAQYGMVPSFFSNHAYFWGDVHLKNLGPERAHFLSPMNSAARLDIHFTNHHDYIVTPMDALFTVWSAVNRVSRSGAVIGADERISALQALRAITLDGAWQNHEENSKGSLQAGKLADLVVLDGNPLSVDPMKIRDIKVLATYKEGREVYTSKGQKGS